MCGIADPSGTLDLAKLAAGVNRDLPSYARPMFVRILKHVDMTGKFVQNSFYLKNIVSTLVHG